MNRHQAKNFACFPKHSSHFNLCVLVQCFLNSRNEVFFEDYLFCFGMHPCNLSEARERRRWCMGIEMQMERDVESSSDYYCFLSETSENISWKRGRVEVWGERKRCEIAPIRTQTVAQLFFPFFQEAIKIDCPLTSNPYSTTVQMPQFTIDQEFHSILALPISVTTVIDSPLCAVTRCLELQGGDNKFPEKAVLPLSVLLAALP